MSFSESPGSIYPALRRLEERDLIRGQIEEGAGMRRRKVFQLTPLGLTELEAWLANLIRREDVIRGAGELMLRFAFMDQLFPKAKIVAFLKMFEGELVSYVSWLKERLAEQTSDLTFTGRVALESGIDIYQARIDWTRRTLTMLRSRRTRGRS